VTGAGRGFAIWARQLDERLLGPGGWLPDDTSYVRYQRETFAGRASPAWVRFGRWFALIALLALQRWGGDSGIALTGFVVVFVVVLVLSLRVDRDIRVAARARRLSGHQLSGRAPGRVPEHD
jgi:hypothetical protein